MRSRRERARRARSLGKPELDDLPRLEQTVRRVHLAAGPVIFISRVPPHAKAPEPQVRDAIVRMLNHFIELCASYHAAMEGSGVAAAGKRTVLSAIFLMTGSTLDQPSASEVGTRRG